jgi:tRNA pseudouridine32 synthase/23S rRNA pseudouridine746 synthase
MLQGLDVDPNPEEKGLPHLGVEIVYEDEAIAVLNKPSGMLSAPGRIDSYSVATWAQQRWKGAMLVHRLDMMTSGIIIVAKTQEAYHHLQRQFEERTIKKKYLALVEGVPEKDHGIIDLPLSSDPINHPRQMVDYEHGKRAITEYRIVKTLDSGSTLELCSLSTRGTQELYTLHSKLYTLLSLWPHTGRTHQLRMHCAHQEGLNCPIVGDELYGHKSDRLYLQAQAITFVHPLTKNRMHIELPDSLT